MICKEELQAEEALTASLLALCRRYETLHPGQELIFLSLPKSDSVQRAQILARTVEILTDA